MDVDNKEGEHGTPVQDGPPHPPADPSPPAPSGESDLRALIDGLNSRINDLENTINGLVTQENDTTPVSRPWTHRGFSKR